MRRAVRFALLCFAWAQLAPAQPSQMPSPAPTPSQSRPDAPPAPSSGAAPETLNTNSTLVLVPALVRDSSGKLVFSLKASDFELTDDGVPQKLHLEENSDAQPLALVVDIEGGKSAIRNIRKFEAIGPMLDAMVGNVPHRIAVVGFDSSPVLVTRFTSDTAVAARGVEDLIDDDNGDNRAAILDSLGFSVDLLRTQPPQYRRAILLISETNGDSSRMKLEDAVRAISDTNTTIYSVGFSTGKSKDGEIWQGLMHNSNMPGPSSSSFSIVPEVDMIRMALTLVIDSLRRNVPETVANLTGGEYFQFLSEKGLARDLGAVANHIPNRYVLSFQPQSPHAGLHVLSLELEDYPQMKITGRRSYWADTGTPEPRP